MLPRLVSLFRNLLRRRAVERDLSDEVASYLQLLVEEKVAAGMAPAAARRAARLEMEGEELAKENVRDVRAGARLELIAREVRYAFRGLRRAPGFTALALLTLVIGIGGNTVIFSLVDALLLKPLPFPEPDRLVAVLESSQDDLEGGSLVTAPNYLDWEQRNRVFDRMALFEYLGFNLSGTGESEAVGGVRTTSGLFTVLGVAPMLGRGFLPSDDQPGSPNVVVLSHRLWRRRFGADSSLIGRAVRINQQPYAVIGVMPPGFAFPSPGQDLWTSIGFNEEDRGRGSHSFLSVARLSEGVSFERARAEIHAIGRQLREEYPKDNAGEGVNVLRMRDLWTTDLKSILRTLFVAVGLVLLISCVNIASLLLARGAARRRELAVRVAIGGSRGRIVGQLVTEGILLATIGAAISLGIATIVLGRLDSVLPDAFRNVPFRDLTTASMSLNVFLFATGVALFGGTISALIPALHVLPTGPAEVLKEGESKGATSRRGRRLRNALVTVEVALALVVLAATGLLVTSIRRVLAVLPGIQPTNVATLGMALPQADFYGLPVRGQYCDALTREATAVPGVVAVGAVSHIPLSGSNAGRSFVIEGRPDPGPGKAPSSNYGVSCPGYFEAMGIPVRTGRDFNREDVVAAPQVVIVNEALAHRFFPGEDPLGKRIKLGRFESSGPWLTVVGVAGDVRHLGLAVQVEPYFYRPYSQAAWPIMYAVVRTAPAGSGGFEPVRKALGRIEPEQPIGTPVLMADVVDRSIGYLRFPTQLFTAFAVMAMLLAAAGIFGVASESVAQRTRELGIRKAVGAAPASVYALIVGQSMRPVLWGIGLGVMGAAAATRLLKGLLFEVQPTDGPTFIIAALVLVAVAVSAVLIPARRAARLDPVAALRRD